MIGGAGKVGRIYTWTSPGSAGCELPPGGIHARFVSWSSTRAQASPSAKVALCGSAAPFLTASRTTFSHGPMALSSWAETLPQGSIRNCSEVPSGV
jgi:hypothetical protein